MTEICRETIDHPSAWRGPDFQSKDDFSFDLEHKHLAAIDEVMAAIRAEGLALDEVEDRHFSHPDFADAARRIAGILRDGCGMTMVRGFPMETYSEDEIGIVYWGLGTHMGEGVSQSVLGDRLGHVRDHSKTDPNARAYRNKQELSLHTDMSEIVSLLCLQTAKSGGLSRLASVVAIHNVLLEEHPEHLDVLYRGFPYHRIGEEAPGEPPVTPWNVPVYSYIDGQLCARYVYECILAGAKTNGVEIPAAEKAALDCFNAIANRDDIVLEFQLEPGEAVFYNNYLVLHARTAFEDGEKPHEIRHLLRLWLDVPNGRPAPAEMNIYGSVGIGKQEGKTPSGAGELYKALEQTQTQ